MFLQKFLFLLLINIFGAIQSSVAHYERHNGPRMTHILPNSDTPVTPRSENRLLNNTEPLHYRVDLSTSVQDREFGFSGTAQLRFRVLNEPITRFRINSYLLEITSCVLFEASAEDFIPGALCTISDRFLDVTVPSPLAANTEFILQVIYTGRHKSASEGFHYSYYVDNGVTRYLASTQFQSVFAREAFPCFDEPSYRVPISIRITHDPSYNALSNAEVESTSNGVTIFKETWKLPSYLVAFVVSDFRCTLKKGKQRICAPPNRMDEVNLAVEASDFILQWMEEKFDEEYEHDKLDHIAIPRFQFGGMENWGLVVYNPSYLLFKDGVDTVSDSINVITVVAHELAHMFWGNLITPKWWSYLWLSEGLATLFEYDAAHAFNPDLRLEELFVVETLHSVLRVDSTGNTRPMTYYVDTVAAIEGIFDSIAYSKAGSVFRMIKYAIGEKTFHKALQKYLDANKNTGVDEKPLYAALEQAIVEDQTAPSGIIATVMDTWSLQGGYPVLTVTRNYADNSISIHQEEFIASGSSGSSQKLWGIPVSFTKKTDAKFENPQANFWMQVKQQSVANDATASDWVIFNLGQTGYYRVNYDQRNWELLIAQLMSNHEVFPPTNRAQLIDDINVLANSGRVDNSLRLSLMEYLAKETDMIPLQAARRHFSTLLQNFEYSTKFPLLQKFVRNAVKESYDAVEKFFFVDERDISTAKSASALIDLACSAGLDSCLTLTRTLTFAELQSQTELVSKGDRYMIFCHGLKTASQRMFNLFDQRFNELVEESQGNGEEEEDLDNSTPFNRMADVSGCYGNKDEVLKVLKAMLVDGNPSSLLRTRLLWSFLSNLPVDLALDFVEENWDSLGYITASPEHQRLLLVVLNDVSRRIYTEDQKEKLDAWLELLSKTEFVIPEQVQVNVKNNFEWVKSQGLSMEAWLVDHFDSGDDTGSGVTVSLSVGLVALSFFIKYLI